MRGFFLPFGKLRSNLLIVVAMVFIVSSYFVSCWVLNSCPSCWRQPCFAFPSIGYLPFVHFLLGSVQVWTGPFSKWRCLKSVLLGDAVGSLQSKFCSQKANIFSSEFPVQCVSMCVRVRVVKWMGIRISDFVSHTLTNERTLPACRCSLLLQKSRAESCHIHEWIS